MARNINPSPLMPNSDSYNPVASDSPNKQCLARACLLHLPVKLHPPLLPISKTHTVAINDPELLLPFGAPTSLRHISPSPSPPSPPRDSSPSSPSGGGLTVSGRCLAGRHFPCLAILSESCPVKLARHHLLLSCLFPANPGILKLAAGDSVNPKCFCILSRRQKHWAKINSL